MPKQARRTRAIRRLEIALLHVVTFAALTAWSWRKWPDPLIDFGRELYAPWQITEGKVLYRDIASLFGPLSPYVNALWFRTFGVSLMTLAACNLAILALMLAGVYHLVRVASDRIAATVATLGVMLLFGFCQYVSVGNYNFVCPYSHEATHGLALSVAALVAFREGLARRTSGLFALSGVCVGLVLLTKPELALAVILTVIAGFAALCVMDAHRPLARRAIPACVAAAAVPPTAFLAYFRLHLPIDDALKAVAGAWTALNPATLGAEFYRREMGLDDPAGNVTRMLLAFGGFVAFCGAAVLVSRGTRTDRFDLTHAGPDSTPHGAMRRMVRFGFLAVVGLVLPLQGFPRALPLTTLAALAATLGRLWKHRREAGAALHLIPMLMWSTFGLALLLKMGLRARVHHYGFYLALPAVSVLVVLIVSVLPQLAEQSLPDVSPAALRLVAVWTLAAGIAPYLALSHAYYRAKALPVGSGRDRFLASAAPGQWQGQAVRDALEYIGRATGPADRVAVLPEGAMLNYLSRRSTPLRVINLMPPEMLSFGEQHVLGSLESAPPRLVLYVHRNVREYGYPPFGADPRYGQTIAAWLEANYLPVRVIGRDPIGADGYGIAIMRRRQDAAREAGSAD